MADFRADFEADVEVFSDLLSWADNISLLAAEILVVLFLVASWPK